MGIVWFFFLRIMQLPSLLGHAQELLLLIRPSDRPADSLIDSFFRSHKYLGSHDRRFIAETTYGTLRHLRRCEVALSEALGNMTASTSREDRSLLLLMSYLLLVERSTSIPLPDVASRLQSTSLKESLDQIVGRIIHADASGTGGSVEQLGIRYSFPDWMVSRFLDQFGGEETERICRSLNELAPLTLRVNTLKTTIKECQDALRSDGVETERTKLSPFGLEVSKRINVFQLKAFREGFFEVQDEGSQILPILIDPKPTARVLDVCAGAGGKTLELAALMKNRGEIVATDVNRFRLQELKKRCRRAGAFNVRVKELQGASALTDDFTGSFDIVLVDAPCSGLGTLRRNPGMKWTVTEKSVHEVSQKQSRILRDASTRVKPGGRLVYATCTLFREENEDIIERFLADQPEFTIIEPNDYLTKWNLTHLARGSYTTLYPHRDGTDGFFLAMLRRGT